MNSLIRHPWVQWTRDHIRRHRGDHFRLVAFSRVMAVGIPLIFGLALPLLAGASPWWTAFLIGFVFLTAGMINSDSLLLPHALWMGLGSLLHRINSWLIFGLLFYLIICPLGIVFRLVGRDPLQRRPDLRASSYRRDFSDDNPLARLENTY